MKILMIIGALAGFLIGLVVGLAGSNPWPTIFWHASVAALTLGLLMRWWGRVWQYNLRQAIEHYLAALQAQRQENQPASTKKL